MSDTYKGLCASKNWTWKRMAFQKSLQDHAEGLDIGASKCLLWTQSPEGFVGVRSDLPEGIVGECSGGHGVYSTTLSQNRKENISRFGTLKSFVETFDEADKALLISRKSSKQVQVLRCGLK